jgi:hypothetical protein
VSDPALSAPGGLAQGFVAYDAEQRAPGSMNSTAIHWIARLAGTRPLFAYLHYRFRRVETEPDDRAIARAANRALGDLFARLKADGLYDESLIVGDRAD